MADDNYMGWYHHRDPLTDVHRALITAINGAQIRCSKTGQPIQGGLEIHWRMFDNSMEIRYVVGGTIKRRRYEERRTSKKQPLEWILHQAAKDCGLDADQIRKDAQVASYRAQAADAAGRGSMTMAKLMERQAADLEART